ncbi:MAG TPA: carbohydrate ABC transporter permease [Thermomicrobiales bacterium]|nr:carbohydrate ABC transporter permease [Thermomicrobiales bacterium]
MTPTTDQTTRPDRTNRPYASVQATTPSFRFDPVLTGRVRRTILHLTVVLGALIFAAPLAWMLATSFKTQGQLFTTPPTFLPWPITLDGYTRPFEALPFGRFYWNTTVITILNIVGLLFSASLAGFAFARMRFPGRNALFVVVLATMMLPEQVTIIPIYVGWTRLGSFLTDLLGMQISFFNTPIPLSLPAFFASNYAGAFAIFLVRQYMMTIPIDYDDAARLDGAGWFQIYWRIVMPQAGPALGVIAIYAFGWNWNDFLGPLIYLNETSSFTLARGLALLNSRFTTDFQGIMAQTVLSLIPVLIVFFLTQRSFIQGTVVSGVK